MRRRSFRAFWLIFLSGLVLLGVLAGCVRSPYSLDQGRAVEKAVSAQKGGEISLRTASGEKVSLAIPQQALKKETTVVATPLTEAPLGDQKDILVKGVLLEEKGKEGKSLNFKYPVFLSFTVKGTLPEGATIVKYLPEKKSYEVISTEVTTKGKETTLTAELTSLSAYGGRKATAGEINKAKKKKKEEGNWVIEGEGKMSRSWEFMDANLAFRFWTNNLSGKITGPYMGSVHFTMEQRLPPYLIPNWAPATEMKTTHKADGYADIRIVDVTDRGSYMGAGIFFLSGEIIDVTSLPVPMFDVWKEVEQLPVQIEARISGRRVTITVVRSDPLFAGLSGKGTLVHRKGKSWPKQR